MKSDNIFKIILLLAVLCLFSPIARAQENYVVGVGGFAGFGYSFVPDFSFEVRPRINLFETDMGVEVSLAPKEVSVSSQTVNVNIQEDLWVNKNFAFVGAADGGELWAQGPTNAGNFTKGGWREKFGVLLDSRSYGQRWVITYIQDVGSKYDPKTGIESSELKGVEVSPELDLFKVKGVQNAVRFDFVLVHGYEQGSPTCDGTLGPKLPGCARTGYVTNSETIRYEFRF